LHESLESFPDPKDFHAEPKHRGFSMDNKDFFLYNILDPNIDKPFFEADQGPEEPELSEYTGSCAKRISIHFPIRFEKFERAYNKAMKYGCPLYVYPRRLC